MGVTLDGDLAGLLDRLEVELGAPLTDWQRDLAVRCLEAHQSGGQITVHVARSADRALAAALLDALARLLRLLPERGGGT